MNGLDFTSKFLRAGIWHGHVTRVAGTGAPRLSAWHLETALEDLRLVEVEENAWDVTVPIPVEALSDGVQTVLLRDDDSGETLDRLALIAGEAASEDLRAEVDLLRAELDMLKRAFRRHCVETAE